MRKIFMNIASGKIEWLKLNGTQVTCERDLVPFGVTWCKVNLEKGDWCLKNGTMRQQSYFFFKYPEDAQSFEIDIV
jgi:hypothetical protein